MRINGTNNKEDPQIFIETSEYFGRQMALIEAVGEALNHTHSKHSAVLLPEPKEQCQVASPEEPFELFSAVHSLCPQVITISNHCCLRQGTRAEKGDRLCFAQHKRRYKRESKPTLPSGCPIPFVGCTAAPAEVGEGRGKQTAGAVTIPFSLPFL